jgi:hypothetical protein
VQDEIFRPLIGNQRQHGDDEAESQNASRAFRHPGHDALRAA